MLFNRGIVLMRLPINQKNKNRKIMKLHLHTTLSFHHKPQCYEK